MHTLSLPLFRQGVGCSCPVQILFGDVLTSPVVFFWQREAGCTLPKLQIKKLFVQSLSDSSALQGSCSVYSCHECTMIGGRVGRTLLTEMGKMQWVSLPALDLV